MRGVGLDDFRLGFSRFPELVQAVDAHFKTKLRSLLLEIGDKSILVRPMTFREAILGTMIMYLFEKELTAARVEKEWGVKLSTLASDEQFIVTSLFYNSGILFSKERIMQIMGFKTGEYLAQVSRDSKRPKLPLYPPHEAAEKLRSGNPIPRQLTSWNAVYHILQRYGAWVALERFANIFNEGRFVDRSGKANS